MDTVSRQLRTLMARAERLLQTIEGNTSITVDPSKIKATESIVDLVCTRTGVPARMVYSRDRHESVARARQICMVLCRTKLRLSLSQVGMLFQRDHGTVMSAETVIANLRETSPKFNEHYATIESAVDSKI